MAICSGCGAETKRLRTLFNPQGDVTGEECDKCMPGSFDPRWKTERGAMDYDANPKRYRKTVREDGAIVYKATDEWIQDQTDRLINGKTKAAAELAEKERIAKEEKRRWRRTQALAPQEVARLAARLTPKFRDKQEEVARGKERARLAWLTP